MTTDPTQGLFSTPEQYQQAQSQAALQNALTMGQLTPEQSARASLMFAGNRAASGIAGALGAQDPQLQMQAARQSILKGVDQTSATSLRDAAQKLADMGDLQAANALAQQSVAIQAKIDEKQAARASMESIAQEKNAIMLQIAQMNAALRGANSDVQRQLIEQRIQDLQVKADEKQATLQSQAQGKVAAFDSALDTLSVIASHPGKKSVVGAVTGGLVSMIPGTDAAGFASQLETFKAQTFIPQVAALKGMGALSDAEGKKLTAAVGALDPKMKQKEFDAQVVKIKTSLEEAKQRALNMPGMPKQATQSAAGTVNNPIVLK